VDLNKGDGDVAALLAAAASGDQSAWDALVRRYSSLLWSVARGYRLGNADAADVVQATWLRLVEHLSRITDPERLAGWLATTTRRECLQLIRRAGRRPRTVDEPADDIVDQDPPVDHELLVTERDRALWRGLATLSERCQRLLRTLMASPPPAYADVAVALDIPVGSIGPSRQRCLAHLRTALTGNALFAEGGVTP
jgi:RNA polymerase sigma factor (sigma-70 family)